MGEHINEDGQFQSDKYKDWCKPDFLALKFTDPTAQPLLWDYAEVIKFTDPELAADIHQRLRAVMGKKFVVKIKDPVKPWAGMTRTGSDYNVFVCCNCAKEFSDENDLKEHICDKNTRVKA